MEAGPLVVVGRGVGPHATPTIPLTCVARDAKFGVSMTSFGVEAMRLSWASSISLVTPMEMIRAPVFFSRFACGSVSDSRLFGCPSVIKMTILVASGREILSMPSRVFSNASAMLVMLFMYGIVDTALMTSFTFVYLFRPKTIRAS